MFNVFQFLFQQLGVLVSVVKSHIKPYLKNIFTLIQEFWTPETPMKSTLIMLTEQLAVALGPEFKPYVTELMPAILRVFQVDNLENRIVTLKVLDTLKICGPILEEHLHVVLPPVIKLFDPASIGNNQQDENVVELAKSALETLCSFAETMNLSQHASRLVHALARCFETFPAVRQDAFTLLYSVAIQTGKNFLVFAPWIDQIIQKHKLGTMAASYLGVIIRLEQVFIIGKEGRIYLEEELLLKKRTEKRAAHHLSAGPIDSQFKKIHCNVAWLQKVHSIFLVDLCLSFEFLWQTWSVSRCVSKEDWMEWLRRLSVELLKESPYPALRACWSVAQNHYPLAKELFNAAFTSCWTELIETVQDDLINSLRQALNFEEVPDITQTVLNLAEFMDHSEKGPLPIEPSLLGERALKTRAYAKALRYTENKFNESCDATVLESLISINNKLQLQEAAHGVIEFAKRRDISITIKERWYEKLHDWQKALDAYEHKQEQNPLDMELTLGRMRCLEALGEWGKLNALAKDKWNSSSVEIKQKMSKMAAAAAWGEGNWDAMEEYVRDVNENTLDGSLFRAVKFIHDGKNNSAQQFIDKARGLVDTELMSLASESYNRAYSTMVTVQLLSELEEAIQFKIAPEKRRLISQTWAFRLKGCQNTVEDWHRILQVRSLVLNPWEMRKTWIKFASLCRKNNKPSLAYKVLSIFGFDLATENCATLLDRPDLVYAYCKQMYYSGKVESATTNLKLLLETSLKSQILQRIDLNERAELWTLKAKCYLKLGQWLETGRSDNDPPSLQVMHYYRYATEWEKNWYKAWHALACTNFSAILYYKNQIAKAAGISSCRTSGALSLEMETSASTQSSAYYGQKLVSNIVVESSLYVLMAYRLLTLWFEYGQNPEVYDTLYEGVKTVRVETWLQVIPQLIARIDTPRQLVSRLIMQLLMDVGKEHPQALVCPLTVAVKSNNKNRAFAATRILTHIGDHSPSLVTQAALLSDELIRVAILWHELWHEGLEEASRQYFAERNTSGMFATLEPLHNMIEVGPTTLKEQSFTQSYARDLKEAKLWCEKFKNSQNNKELTQAWDLYYNVFRRISKQLPQLTTLELHYISPKLLLCQNMELAVPGTYDPSRPIIKIQSIHSTLHVITSKQRPRKVCIKGSDGNDYWFLLKGHEDPRQDERVMQLFGLVNTLLMQDPTTSRRNLTIQRYSVTPLSQNSGLIGWVPNCDTLHALLRDYRDKKKVLLNIEHKLMQRMAPDYDHLTLMQKVEVFEHAMEHSNGDDLQKILWLKSPSSEVWFDRRTNYTRSLATMSMVGYILGLGDRHPSNLMLDRMSGKIVHIDFGDCFEVAMNREKYPEKIPFRLTRMLIKAMEVTGLEGNFRITCERVMTVLREHKESVMAVLEAFVYDPLINWRLVEQCNIGKKTNEDDVLKQLNFVENLKTNGGVGAGVNNSNANAVKTKLKSEDSKNESTLVDQAAEVGSKRALQVIQRIRDKLAGRDFNPIESLDVHTQVELLVQQAISHENLCQCYIGWCPFW
uniref:non-specific serine/threonine protein kinase n=1 Tax=Romanomermis culicivorax TaxID=13658 RepID=A0A915JVW2_ROMCU